MPNWSDDEGFSWFNKLSCKRCLVVFEPDGKGEVPLHECLGGYFTSYFDGHTYHTPKFVSMTKPLKFKAPKKDFDKAGQNPTKI